jgi:hypothetical protein
MYILKNCGGAFLPFYDFVYFFYCICISKLFFIISRLWGVWNLDFGTHFSLIFNWFNSMFAEDQWIQIDSFLVWNSWVLKDCASSTHHGFSFSFVILTFWQKSSKKFVKLVKFTSEKKFKNFQTIVWKKKRKKIHFYLPLHPFETHYDLVTVGTNVGWVLKMKPNSQWF